MTREELMLAAMSPAGTGPFSPVQVQKLFFLLDRNISAQTKGPHFRFEPYDYGPFDKEVYWELENLKDGGQVEIAESTEHGPRTYRLTNDGLNKGEEILGELTEPVQQYIRKVVKVVRSLSFSQLVSAIYQAYPEMKKNSVFGRPIA